MMSGMDDNSTGDGKTGKLASGRNSLNNSGFNGVLTCPSCDEGVDHNILEITEGIDLPTDERYYDKYDYSTSNTTYSRGILGDATKEMGPFQSMQYLTQFRNASSWYSDEAWFVYSGNPWVARGGVSTFGTGAGIFTFNHAHGISYAHYSFRLALAF